MSNSFETNRVMQGEVIDGRSVVERSVVEPSAAMVAKLPITIRLATEADLPLIDKMQKAHSKELGFLPTQALVGKVKLGQVLVAEVDSGELIVDRQEQAGGASLSALNQQRSTVLVGYLIAADRYFKRDEVGYITQINVLPEYRRHLVAAQLLQYQFDRSATGCKLYCCWCAQDLKANEFWESMGFVPIAFRNGANGKGKKVAGKAGRLPGKAGRLPGKAGRLPRVHIFWQKRIRPGDTTTMWWYPSQTGGGELREDRLVFPVMPGTNWREVEAIVLPEEELNGDRCNLLEEKVAVKRVVKRVVKKVVEVQERPPHVHKGGFWFARKEEREVEVEEEVEVMEATPKVKINPRLLELARELRDQWSDRVAGQIASGRGKHDVVKLAFSSASNQLSAKLLDFDQTGSAQDVEEDRVAA
jgi:ribosomal protein S18 acetylase RimI-like enzyme